MTPHDIAKKIREALDADRWGDWDIEAIGPVKPVETGVTIFATNEKTGEDLTFSITVEEG